MHIKFSVRVIPVRHARQGRISRILRKVKYSKYFLTFHCDSHIDVDIGWEERGQPYSCQSRDRLELDYHSAVSYAKHWERFIACRVENAKLILETR